MKKLVFALLTLVIACMLSLSSLAANGEIMPSTGGIGTKIFTVAGIAVMLVAVVLLIVRRKMASDK